MKPKFILLLSLLAGLLAAFLTRAYLASKDAELKRLKQRFITENGTMEVICYNKDVPAGTALAKRDLGILTVPAKGLRGQAIPPKMVDTVVGRKILAGHRRAEVLFWGDLEGGSPFLRTLAHDVRRQMRAISINVSGAAAVSGMVRPADHVDVIGTFSFPGPNDAAGRPTQKFVTSTILQNVLVLATGHETAKSVTPAGSAGSYATVTLEVSPREAEILVFAEQMRGRLALTLRNPNDISFEKELPKVDFDKIQGELEALNLNRQSKNLR